MPFKPPSEPPKVITSVKKMYSDDLCKPVGGDCNTDNSSVDAGCMSGLCV